MADKEFRPKFVVGTNNFQPKFVVSSNNFQPQFLPPGSGGTRNYRHLINKPTINGTELFDNYDEIDPTVHEWAKEPTKPAYTPEEIGAIDEDNEVSFADLLSAWRDVFG